MKTQLKISLLALSLTALLYGGGCTPDLLPIPMTPEYAIIDGDTVKTNKDDIYKKHKDKLYQTQQYVVVGDTLSYYKKPKKSTTVRKVDLAKIKDPKDSDKNFKMAAIGDGLTAGMRDGGYYNEGIETSYPNLIARQMGISFNQPIFDNENYNGVGRLVRSGENFSGGPFLKMKYANNNTAIEDDGGKDLKIKKSQVKDIDNYGCFGMISASLVNINRQSSIDNLFSENGPQTVVNIMKTQLTRRIFEKAEKATLTEKMKIKKYDFILFHFGGLNMTEFGRYYITDGRTVQVPQDFYISRKITLQEAIWSYNGTQLGDHYMDYNIQLMKQIDEATGIKKGVVYNMPDYSNTLPYFKGVSQQQIQSVLGQQSVFLQHASLDDAKIRLLPVGQVDSLLSPKVNIALKTGLTPDNPITRYYEAQYNNDRIMHYNSTIKLIANEYQLAFVDLFDIYSKIAKGDYITSDGVKVDPSWPNGNFFSLDGIYPTAFGQAVIANETIKAINTTYGTAIPLINTREFLD